jgi:hypothetical protein
MLRFAGPDGAEGRGLGAADGVGHGTAGTLAGATDVDGDPPAPTGTELLDDVAPQPASNASAASTGTLHAAQYCTPISARPSSDPCGPTLGRRDPAVLLSAG